MRHSLDFGIRYPITIPALEDLLFYKDYFKICDFNKLDENFRMSFIATTGIFGLPCKEFLFWLNEFSKDYEAIYDVGAGVGYLSYGLKKINRHAKIIALDNYSTLYKISGGKYLDEKFRLWYPILFANARFYLREVKNCLFIFNWPDYRSSLIHDIASTTAQSNDILYIGEGISGCTANRQFFKKFQLTQVNVPWLSWSNVNDKVYFVNK